MRVLLADDQPEVRSALRCILEQKSDLSVVGEAAEVQGLLDQLEAVSPDLILLDWELPGLDATNLPTALHPSHLRPLLIALSGLPGAQQSALAAGVDAFVSKGDPPEQLLATLQAVEKTKAANEFAAATAKSACAD